MNEPPIQLSVALPIWRSKNIAWLALESLANQDIPDFNWELVVCEEKHDQQLGQLFFDEYFPRLKEKNCSIIKYIEIDEWVPLLKKWRTIGQNIDANSKVFMLQAADCYSFKERLKETYKRIVGEGYSWYSVGKGYFYDFSTKKMILYCKDVKIHPHLNMSFVSSAARSIPNSNVPRGVDGFLFRYCERTIPEFKHHVDFQDYASLDTHGYNNISFQRSDRFINPKVPFVKTNKKLEDIGLPPYIVDGINKMSVPEDPCNKKDSPIPLPLK